MHLQLDLEKHLKIIYEFCPIYCLFIITLDKWMKNVRLYTDVLFRTEFITPFVSRLWKKNALASLSPSQLTRVVSLSRWLFKILRPSSSGILLERQLHGPLQREAREPNWIPYKLGSRVCPALYWGKESGSVLSCVLKAARSADLLHHLHFVQHGTTDCQQDNKKEEGHQWDAQH